MLSFPIDPMRATLGTLPTDDGWAFEVKWDGYRTVAFVADGQVRLQSSRGHDITGTYPELAGLADAINTTRAVLDGELVVVDDRGRPRFELLQQHRRQATLLIFDVLSIDGHDTIGLPYERRRRLLDQLVHAAANWSVPPHHVGDGNALLDVTAANDLEGVIAKRLTSPYRPGTRTRDWRKVKHRHRTEVVIGGYSAGTGNRATTFGALLVGRLANDGQLAFAGGVGTGFTQQTLENLTARLRDLRIDHCPFDPPPPRTYQRSATWVEPVLTAEIEIAELTNTGYVRQASFIRLAPDS